MALDQALSPPQDYSGRAGTVAFWQSKGVPQHVAEGIADRVNAESSSRSTAWNPNDKGSPSGGLYQHHADRLTRLMQQPNWQQPRVQHEFAFSEVMGGDPQAAAHWKEIQAAPDRATAAKLWDRYFERSAGGVGGGQRMGGRFGAMGPRVPGTPDAEGGDEASQLRERFDRLARSLKPPEAAPAVAPVQPEAAAAPAAPMVSPLRLAPAPIPQMPDLRGLYRTQLARVLGNGGVIR